MDAKSLCGFGLISLSAVENPLDETFLKFLDGFVKQNALLHHLRHEPFQLILHGDTLRSL
jgi:hypothetical protein